MLKTRIVIFDTSFLFVVLGKKCILFYSTEWREYTETPAGAVA